MDKYQAVKNFLEYVSPRIQTDQSAIGRIIESGKSYSMLNFMFFEHDETYNNLQRQCIKAIYNKLSPTTVREDTIKKLLKDSAIKQKDSNKDETNYFFNKLTERVVQKFNCIIPNHALILMGLDSFNIGCVSCIKASDIHSKYPDLPSDLTYVIRPEGHGIELINGEWIFYLPEQCFSVNVSCSDEMVREKALWNVDVALSLFRLFALSEKVDFGHFPRLGELDPTVECQRVSNSAVSVFGEKSWSGGGSTIHPFYTITNEVADTYNNSIFMEVAEKVFSPKEGTIQERLQRTLGWLTKGRVAESSAIRFLMFFTALETLLTEAAGNAPIVDTISRNAATILTKVPHRHETFQRLRELYHIRSRLVHSGVQDVSISDCNTLQYMCEATCFIVLTNAIDQSEEEFRTGLKEAGFGLPWPITSKTV